MKPQISGAHSSRATDSVSSNLFSNLKERKCRCCKPAPVSVQIGHKNLGTGTLRQDFGFGLDTGLDSKASAQQMHQSQRFTLAPQVKTLHVQSQAIGGQ